MKVKIYPKIVRLVGELVESEISIDRLLILDKAIESIQLKLNKKEAVKLHFICTHNSRRSQLSEIWAKTIASFYGIPVQTYSGGMEVTAFHTNAIAALIAQGFKIDPSDSVNPECLVFYADAAKPQKMFSKLIDDDSSPTEGFIAFMTCDHASDNCPFVIGAERRIELPFEDPKQFDDRDNAMEFYKKTSNQIANEMNYIFSRIISSNG